MKGVHLKIKSSREELHVKNKEVKRHSLSLSYTLSGFKVVVISSIEKDRDRRGRDRWHDEGDQSRENRSKQGLS